MESKDSMVASGVKVRDPACASQTRFSVGRIVLAGWRKLREGVEVTTPRIIGDLERSSTLVAEGVELFK